MNGADTDIGVEKEAHFLSNAERDITLEHQLTPTADQIQFMGAEAVLSIFLGFLVAGSRRRYGAGDQGHRSESQNTQSRDPPHQRSAMPTKPRRGEQNLTNPLSGHKRRSSIFDS
jgi:hypothetical protein